MQNKILIKKYPNRRLYNTAASKYITLDEVSSLICRDYNIKVVDVKSGQDITGNILIQVIQDKYALGHELIPAEFLSQIIKLAGSPLSLAFQQYLKVCLDYFQQNHNFFSQYTHTGSFKEIREEWLKSQQKGLETFMDFFKPFNTKD